MSNKKFEKMKKLFKKKKKTNSFCAMTATTLFCFIFTACGGSDDAVMNLPTQQTPVVTTTDPVGTIVLNFKKGTSANEQSVGVGRIYMDNAGNFNFDKGERILVSTPLSGSYYAYDNDGIEFSSVGKVDGLSGITTIPSKGWSESIAITANTGYIIYKSNKGFARLYVESVTPNEATVKYQYPFCVAIDLKQSNFTVQKESKVIYAYIVNPTSVSEISGPEWCNSYVVFDSKTGETYVLILVTENNTGEKRIGEISLKNDVNTAKITVIQEG